MSGLNLALTIGGGVVLGLGLLSGYIKNRFWISETAVCLLVGALIGPHLMGLLAEGVPLNPLLREAARITIGIAVMAAALRLPSDFIARCWRDLGLVLTLGMLGMWLASSVLAWLWFDLSLLSLVLIGAVLTPTDPVVSGSIVTSKLASESVPSRISNLLSAESGANDGLALLLVMAPILLMLQPTGAALGHWLTVVLLREILLAVVLGALAGWVAGRLLVWARRQPWSEPASTLTVGLALTLTVLASVKLLHSDGILAVFVAGLLFNRSTSKRDLEQERLQEAIGRFFDLPIFIIIGATLPWSAWYALGWPAVGFALTVLLLRRLPWWLMLNRWIRSTHDMHDGAFYGWFGPIGVASAYYAALAAHDLGQTQVWHIASAAIAASVLAHGITATPLTRVYARAAHREDV